MITTATKEVTFDAAHRLSFHTGKCYNLHGHTYKLCLTLACQDLRENMVLDFYKIKKILQKIVDEYDHSTMLFNGNADNKRLMNLLIDMNMKVVAFPFEPTVENMARHFAEIFEAEDLPVSKVTMYETPTSYAEVIL